MPRANRNFLPGHIWHITHRCHKKEFLLRFRMDKRAWIRWAIEAERRFDLAILNFMITSNHIHLLAMAMASATRAIRGARGGHGARGVGGATTHPGCSSSAIPSALQLIESRVGQAYNVRKDRHGAFWEGRYHATAIESGLQLARCMTYIDMNMVRARVVGHPRDWPWCGYRELGREVEVPRILRRRGFVVDTDALLEVMGAPDVATLFARRSDWIDAAIRKGRMEREAMWTESVAVGSEKFLEAFQSELGPRIGAAEICKDAADGDLLYLRRTRGNPMVVFGRKNVNVMGPNGVGPNGVGPQEIP
jgi:putative transposase